MLFNTICHTQLSLAWFKNLKLSSKYSRNCQALPCLLPSALTIAFLSLFIQSTRHLFTPADRRIPRIRIETRQGSTLAGQRIMVAIDGWPKHSRYPNVSWNLFKLGYPTMNRYTTPLANVSQEIKSLIFSTSESECLYCHM